MKIQNSENPVVIRSKPNAISMALFTIASRVGLGNWMIQSQQEGVRQEFNRAIVKSNFIDASGGSSYVRGSTFLTVEGKGRVEDLTMLGVERSMLSVAVVEKGYVPVQGEKPESLGVKSVRVGNYDFVLEFGPNGSTSEVEPIGDLKVTRLSDRFVGVADTPKELKDMRDYGQLCVFRSLLNVAGRVIEKARINYEKSLQSRLI